MMFSGGELEKAFEDACRLFGCLLVVCPLAVIAAVVFAALWWFK